MSEAATPKQAGPTLGRRLLIALPVIAFAGLAALFYAQLFSGRDPATIPSALIGKPAPDLALPPLEGLLDKGTAVPGFSRADLATGEVTVVNMWASWCGPCRVEHPNLIALKATGVRMFGMNYKDDPENARRFLGGLGNPFSRVATDATGRAAIEWGVYGVPETFVIDGRGRIAYKFVGPIADETGLAKLKAAIEKAKAAK